MDEDGGKYEFADQTSGVWGQRSDYLSYLVRLWRVGQGAEEHWRASLQRPGGDEPIWFADVEDALAYLRAQTGEFKSG
jgi:hypothetical protein